MASQMLIFCWIVMGVVSSFVQRQASHLRASVAIAGAPTNYRENGCWKTSEVEDEIAYNGPELMSREACFAFCASKKGVKYFGLSEGNKCWCGSIWQGDKKYDKSCDEKCFGNVLQTCGGIDATNIFVLYDCTEDTAKEKKDAEEEATNELIDSYGAFTEQTCGLVDDNYAEIDDDKSMSGSVNDCKLACWNGKGSEMCHGFSYYALTERCVFHIDVLAGEVKYEKRSTCYFKKI